MKVFVAGATGALGKQLVPRLAAAGHEVFGMTRSEQRADLVRELGAQPVVADALNADAVGTAVSTARPDVIVHQLTALSGSLDLRHFDRAFAQTNRLRTEGTDILLSAARAAGARRFVAQSFAGWPAERSGGPVKSEDDPLDPDPPAAVRPTLEAILHLERAVTGAAPIEGLALRYGGFYGPGTSLELDPPAGEHVDAIRERKFPIVGGGGGVWSFVHIEDAAEATAIAVERGAPGVYNVVDDHPSAVRDWLPEAARELGAKRPRRVPRWLGRVMAGQAATVMMTEIRGASNAKARRELGWVPRHPSLVGTLAGSAA
jgi:nucleoside-diphosphate-sugar epimerase